MNENLANRALEVLNRDQDQLKGAYEKQSDYDAPDKIEKVTVTENSDGTWSQNKELVESGFKDGGVIGEREAQIEEEAEILQEFCAEIDNKIIGILTQIDAKKREIVTLSLTAGISTGTEDSPLNFCNSSLGVGIVTLFDINEDTETVKIYTKMAGPNVDYGTENPFEPDTTISLSGVTTHYAGFGYENVAESSVYKNSAGSVTGLKTDGSGPGISTNGRLDLAGTGTPFSGALTCAQIKTQIDSLYGDIIVLRNEIGTLRGNLNIVKNKKSEKELQNWGCKNIRSEVNARATSESSVISAVVGLSTSNWCYYIIKPIGYDDMGNEHVSSILVDICKRTVIVLGNEGDTRVIECETVNEFMNVLKIIDENIEPDMVVYAKPSVRKKRNSINKGN